MRGGVPMQGGMLARAGDVPGRAGGGGGRGALVGVGGSRAHAAADVPSGCAGCAPLITAVQACCPRRSGQLGAFVVEPGLGPRALFEGSRDVV